ncbi:hypothetical protein LINPERPRIM_LOCUS6097 [Linum perenne]
MATGADRSKPPLHNFNLPCLKWGNQRHLRCMKVPDSSNSNPRNNNAAADRHHNRSSRSPPSKFSVASRNSDARLHQFKKPNPRTGGGADEGIEAVGKKIIFDFKTEVDRMKFEFLRKKFCDEDGDEDEEEDAEEQYERRKSSPAAASAAAAMVSAGASEKENDARPWNLRTRRAACKAPIGASPATGKGLRIEERKDSSYSPMRFDSGKLTPRLRGDRGEIGEEKEEKPRAKFSASLSRKEIEDDFMAMFGHRPARRPKKRPRIVQKQLDSLFPGLWLGEVTAEWYKVPENPDTGKVITNSSLSVSRVYAYGDPRPMWISFSTFFKPSCFLLYTLIDSPSLGCLMLVIYDMFD